MIPLVGVISKVGIIDAICWWLLHSVKATTTHIATSCRIALILIAIGGELINIR